MKLGLCVVLLGCCVMMQQASSGAVTSAALGSTQFALELLQSTSIMAGKYMNVAISPFSVWSMLALLQEGSSGNTNLQLQKALHHMGTNKDLRNAFRKIQSILNAGVMGVELDNAAALFTNEKQPLKWEFEYLANKIYGASILPVNFSDLTATVDLINRWVANVTHQRINSIVHKDDMLYSNLVIANGLFFKGKWEIPFNSSLTYTDKFYDDKGEEIGEVKMMQLVSHFRYSYLDNLGARIVELPYQGQQYSMFMMVPSGNMSLDLLVERLSKLSMEEIYQRMKQEDEEFPDAIVQVLVPRVVILSDYQMNKALEMMGVVDLFSESRADLSKMSAQRFFLHKMIHKTEIVISEEGTIASSATGGTFSDRSPMPVFQANRPFLFFIVEKSMNIVMFAGKVVNPHM